MKNQLQGKIVSLKMQKTAVVEVKKIKEHPIYRKKINFNKKYKAHLDQEGFKEGDNVIIEETTPISKDKKWRVVQQLA
ncbi:30S ribosomal protein S17 [Candidatus Gribaldobacteria bacterium]|nr:30S ribosomal protein S17 [Candidatus Gribaldobacteria bacterium]